MSVLAAGLALVGATYLVDAVGAPIVALDHNRRQRAVQPFVSFRQDQDGGKLIGMSFDF